MQPGPSHPHALPLTFRLFVVALAVPAVVVAVAGVPVLFVEPINLLWVVFLSAANLVSVPMLPQQRVEMTFGSTVGIASAVLLPPPVALLVNLLGVTGEPELHRATSLWLIISNRANAALSAGLASLAAGTNRQSIFLAAAVAVFVQYVAETLFVGVSLYTRGRGDLKGTVREALLPYPGFALNFALVASLALLIVIGYERLGPWAVLLVVPPMWLGYTALTAARQSEDRAEELAVRVRELEMLNELGQELLNARDPLDVVKAGRSRLCEGLETEVVEVSLDGDVSPNLHVVKVPRAEPAAVGVPDGLDARTINGVEAVADLLGITLQGLDLERELAESQQARANLAAGIIEEGTRERSRIALEIHDDVLPYLAAAEIQSDNVKSLISIGQHQRADQLAAKSRDAVHDGISRLRDVIEALRQQVIVPGELRPALVAALSDLRLHYGVQGRLCAPDPLPELPLAVEIALLETVRGCLANVGKHALAEHVEVAVSVAPQAVVVQIGDDGRGFDSSVVPAGHHGLALMQQRVELARGTFTVASVLNRGTTVTVEVPL